MLRRLTVWQCALLASALVFLCLGAGASADVRKDKLDARALLLAVGRYYSATPERGLSTQRVLRHYNRTCAMMYRGEKLAVRQLIREHLEYFVMYRQPIELLPAYRELLSEMERRNVSHPYLKTLVQAAQLFEREATKLSRLRATYCVFLQEWRAHGWRPAFESRWYLDRYSRLGVDIASLRRTQRRLSPFASLTKLGLSPQESLEVVSGIRLPFFL